MEKTTVKGKYINLKELEVGTVCFTKEKKGALEITKQNLKDHETTVKILDKLAPEQGCKCLQTVADSQIVMIPLDKKDLKFLLSADVASRVSITPENAVVEKTVKHKKEKINFEDVPDIVQSVDEVIEYKTEALDVMTDKAIKEHEAGLTKEFPVENEQQIVEELIKMPEINNVHVVHNTVVCESVYKPEPVKKRGRKAKAVFPIENTSSPVIGPVNTNSLLDEEIPIVIIATLFVGQAPKSLGSVVQEVYSKMPELSKPAITAMIRHICSISTASIKRNGEMISLRDL